MVHAVRRGVGPSVGSSARAPRRSRPKLSKLRELCNFSPIGRHPDGDRENLQSFQRIVSFLHAQERHAATVGNPPDRVVAG